MRRSLLLFVLLASCKPSTSSSPPAASVSVAPIAAEPPPSAAPSASAPAPSAAKPSPVVRETKTVKVDGAEETWTLRWKSPPTANCLDKDWWVGPCQGFEYGEKGALELLREHPGAAPEILDLGDAALPKYKVEKSDSFDAIDVDQIKKRPVVPVMKIGDYDHDGRETEFVLATITLPAGHTHGVLVGISKQEPKLHVFKNAEDGEDLTLDHLSSWEKVRSAKASPVSFVTVTCGDHGSDVQQSSLVSFGPKGLSMKDAPPKECP